MSPKELEKVIKGFANRRRLVILKMLSGGKELNVSQISEKLKLSFRATSQHLKVLENADLVQKRQEVLMMYYSLSSRHGELIKTILKNL